VDAAAPQPDACPSPGNFPLTLSQQDCLLNASASGDKRAARDWRRGVSELKPINAPPLENAEDPSAILGALDAVVYDWDIASDRLTWGPNVDRTLRGAPRAALDAGETFAALVTADSEASRYPAVFNSLATDEGHGVAFRVQYRIAGSNGAALEVEDFGRWFADADGRPRRVHGLVRVLSRAPLAANEAPLEIAENTLSSRRAFNTWVDAACAAAHADRGHALMVIGLADLSAINAREGYDVADELILGVGRRLAQSLRGGDRLVRYAGGKFALFVALGPTDQPAVAAARLRQRAVAEPYPTSAGPMRPDLRVGAALAPRHARTAHLLLQRADEAFVQTSASAEPIVVYGANDALAESRRRDAWIADEIVAALNDRRILLAFQPIAPTNPGPPAFEEALLRLRMEDGALLFPDAVIPTAEKLGLIELIDNRVLELAIQCLTADPRRRISVNISIGTLRAADWFERLRDQLSAAPGAAQRLILEIVETQMIGDVAEAARILARVRTLGVRIAMDDFGAGYTSFRNLRLLGVDMVKIDGAFVQNLASSIDDRFFVRTLASLARHLGVLTVAEWVEDEETCRLLGDWDVDYVQGHYIGRAEIDLSAEARALAASRARA
jgi:diguanylate cyclase (GGDEF)-like protein